MKSEHHADVIIRPNIYDSSFKDMKQALVCIERGEEAAMGKFAEIRKYIHMMPEEAAQAAEKLKAKAQGIGDKNEVGFGALDLY